LNKNNEIFQNDIWSFKNIYNKYFCFCKGSCKYSNISQLCKYQFYLYIIDNNKYLYKKTDYLFSDFYQTSSDDTYPIFKEMIKKNISAHYIDKKKEIYQKYCKKKKVCTKVINSFNTKLLLNGDFLEKYLELILRLKAVVVGHKITSFYNILYCIDYIEYINLGHGIKYIKHFLYNDYSSHTKYNKLVLPPSTKIIKMAIKYGWNEKNIIKNCLPKWDKYDIYKNNLKLMNKNKSIFILFTWRCLKKENLNISSMYLNNIRDLVNNIILNKIIRKNNITLYFTLHPNFKKYNRVFKFNKSIKYISHKNISNCLMESNLLITDFSSVIFDIIYQKKPYIMFIPDAEDKNIKYIYQKGYYEIIDSLKNRSLYFENTFFDVNKTLIKIIYYIEHHFKLDDKLKKFYDSFQFKCGNNTDKFINYVFNWFIKRYNSNQIKRHKF
jgi:CDP-glycerol glycerophosphotransferase (TagB/SpsB family)